MKLEYAGISRENLKSGISLSAITNSTRSRIIRTIFTKKNNNMLDWLDLPNMFEELIYDIDEYGKYIRRKFDNFIVLGIGGSALGIKLLKNTFVDSINKDIGINVEVCDNIDSDTLLTMMNKLNLKKTMFCVITKSGTTSETLAQMMLALGRYKAKKINPKKVKE